MMNNVAIAVAILVTCGFIVAATYLFDGSLSGEPAVGPISRASASWCETGAIGEFESAAPNDSRDQFLWEIQNSNPSAQTPLFSDRPESYHVVKSDLIAGVLSSAENSSDIRAIVIVGPKAILWSYDIIVISEGPEGLHSVRTHFAHARIKFKGSSTTDEEALQKLAASTGNTPHVFRSGPTTEQLRNDLREQCWGEFNYDFLVAFPSDDGIAFRMSSLLYAPEKFKEEILSRVNDLIEDEKATYRHGDAVSPPAA
jgi:hypothetical protein